MFTFTYVTEWAELNLIFIQAFTNVITNDKQEKRRQENGKTDLHRQQSKQSKKKRSKLERRKKAVEHLKLSRRVIAPTSKKNLTECIRLDITSPEKTDDKNSTKRVRLPFPWKSTRLCKGFFFGHFQGLLLIEVINFLRYL
ncbi:uncharacterized protein LOC134270278 [Saccostrea cucullata]|uniref:uncharacterized protein LOC134270278 n=1 Tax=Saccostrea cuccullata TaxID=36930 RepID=UPI002ED36005